MQAKAEEPPAGREAPRRGEDESRHLSRLDMPGRQGRGRGFGSPSRAATRIKRPVQHFPPAPNQAGLGRQTARPPPAYRPADPAPCWRPPAHEALSTRP